MEDKIKLGISSCLLGNKVRYDGQHSYNQWLVERLGNYVEYTPVCPEVECGLPIPREAMRLVGDIEKPRLLGIFSKTDHTPRMQSYAKARVEALKDKGLCGFVFRSKSPSSGMERVKVYPEGGGPSLKKGVGLFAKELMQAMPLLPFEEEGRLNDPILRENFIERIFVMHRWNALKKKDFSLGLLVDFHTRHKLLIMAHSVNAYRELGKLVAVASTIKSDELKLQYITKLMQALALPATVSKHRNVLQHIMGYFKKDLSAAEKAELLELIEAFTRHEVPLIVPITMLNHYTRKYDKEYLSIQYYLHPHPQELALRNHV